ncbi:FecR family protein [Bacteroides graminisolvens]
MDKEKKKNSVKQINRLVWLSDLLQRYFKNEVTKEEKEVIEEWQPTESPAYFSPQPNEIQEGCERVKDNVFAFLNISKLDLKNKVEKEKRFSIKAVRRYAAVAAVFALLIGTGLYITQSNEVDRLLNTEAKNRISKSYYQTDDSEIKKVKLCDGSILHLNGGTKLSLVANEFNKSKREVWLENGEVFFEVKKDSTKPFIVHSGNLATIVKGTSFNIKAYAELNENVISVRSGKVEVKKGKESLGLYVKNTQLTYYSDENRSVSEKTNWEDAAAWINGILVFHNADKNELSLRLRQKFGVSIICAETILHNTKLNTRFNERASLNDILNNICTLYGLKYSISNKNVNIYK